MLVEAARLLVSQEVKDAYWLGWDMAQDGYDKYSSPLTDPTLITHWVCGHRDYHNPDVKTPKFPRPERNPKWDEDGF